MSHFAVRHSKVFRYLFVSGLSASITVGLPILLHEVFAVVPETAVAIALATAFVVNFFTVRRFVFRSRERVLPQVLKFALMTLSFRLLEYGLFLALYQLLGFHYVVAILCTQIAALILKYYTLQFVVFAPEKL